MQTNVNYEHKMTT